MTQSRWVWMSSLLTYFDVRLAALILKNVALDSYATAFAWKYSTTSPCRASSIGSQHDAACFCCGAPAPPAGRYRSVTGTRRSQGAQQQTNRTRQLTSIDGTDRRTDGRTTDSCIDPTPHVTRAASLDITISNSQHVPFFANNVPIFVITQNTGVNFTCKVNGI